MSISTKNKCRSKNPANCRYHGSLEVHTKVLGTKTKAYFSLITDKLAGGDVTERDIQDAAYDAEEARATVDAHDENYNSLKASIADLAAATADPDYLLDDPADYLGKELRDTKERVARASIVREKASRSETDKELGWTSSYVTHLQRGSIISSGEKIVAVRGGKGLGSKKREVVLEDENGNQKARIWGSYSRVTVLPPSAQIKDPNSVVDVPVGDVEDAWAPKD